MHHTKVKADIGLSKVISDLAVKGHVACVPLSEHQPYDLVVVTNQGLTIKVQVKYSTLKKNGTVDVRYRRNWSDSKGSYTKPYTMEEFDYYAIYCPEKDKILYVQNDKNCPKAIRFDRTANNQAQGVKWASNYLDI